MNPLNAGLPARAALGAGAIIGSAAFFTKGPGVVIDAAGGEWLAGGTQVLASFYPKAAKLDHLQAHGTAATLGAALPTSQAWSFASNGAGVILCAYGSALQVLRSGDGGVTWGTVAAGIGSGVVSNVVFEPISQRFYVFGNDAASVSALQSTSAAGTAFGAGFAATPGGGGAITANTVRVAVRPDTGTIAIRVTTSAGGRTTQTIASGASVIVNRGLPGISTQATTLLYNSSGHLVDYPLASGGLIYTSADDGVTWSNPGNTYAAPSGANVDQQPIWYPAANAWFIFADAGAYYVVTNNVFTPANHTLYRMIGVRHPTSRPSVVGARLVIGIKDPNAQNARQLLCTKDGFRWTAKGTSQALGSVNKGLHVHDSGAGVIIVPVDDGAAQTGILRTPSLDQPLYVGAPLATDVASSSSPASLFYKVA